MELQPRQEHHEVKDTTPPRSSINTHTHTRNHHHSQETQESTYPSNRKKAFVGVGMKLVWRRNGPGARRQTAAVPSGPERRKGYPRFQHRSRGSVAHMKKWGLEKN